MADERAGGPVSMSQNELAAFVAEKPDGAICVIDDEGHLLALPGRVLDYRDDTLTVEIDRVDPGPTPNRETPACMVADTFTSYLAIRGVIAQGTVSWPPPAAPHVVAMSVSRTMTFSFANA
jgi:hypothetical protein